MSSAPPRFVLASASTARLALLRRVGIEPDVIVSGVPEDDVTGTPAAVVAALAARKATAVAGDLTGDVLVLGCDSVLDLDGAPLGKPASPDVARDRWHTLRGRSGILRTGHCLLALGEGHGGTARAEAVASTVVRFGAPTDRDVDVYIATGEPLHVAGAFTIDGFGAALVDAVEGSPTNVIGCCIPTLRRLLDQVGHPISSWWVERAASPPAGGP